MKVKRFSWKETRSLIRYDRLRLLEKLEISNPHYRGKAYFHPGSICVVLYRLSNHFYRANKYWTARIFWHLNLLITGADISEPADIDAGLLIPYPAGVAIMGTAGKNLTVMACAGLGGETGRFEDIGAGPGLSKLGDDVTLEPHAGVLGPVLIGNSVHIEAGICVTRDIPDNCRVYGHRARILSTIQKSSND